MDNPFPTFTVAKPPVVWPRSAGVLAKGWHSRKESVVDNSSYALFLILGTALVFADGQVIYRSGLRYLANSYSDRNSARSMARLVSTLFHLAVLGVLAMISTVHVAAGTPMESVVLRLGIVLVVLALAHGITVSALTRIANRLGVENGTMRRRQAHDEHRTQDHYNALAEQRVPVEEVDCVAE